MNQQSGSNNSSQDALLQEFKEQEQSCKKQEEKTRSLEMKAVQNVNIFFVFQAVILASTSKSGSGASLKCHHWWIPFVLSLLATIFNLITFCDAMFQVLKSRAELEQSVADLALMKMYSMPKGSFTQVLPGTPLDGTRSSAMGSSGQGEVVRRLPELTTRVKLHFMVYMSIISFLGFSGIIMYGTRVILC